MLRKRVIKSISVIFISLALFGCNDDEVSIIENQNEENPILEIDFTITFGGSGIDDAISVVEANDGGYAVLGTTNSIDGDITDKTSTDLDFWLIKLDASGQMIWNRTYGGSEDERARSIFKTQDGGYVLAGQSRSSDGDVSSNAGFFDFWIVKVGSQGAIEWEKNYGFAGNDQAYDIFQTSDGGFFVSGILDVTASGGQGNSGRNSNRHAGGDYWTLKLDASGELIWSRYFGGSFTDTSHDAVETDNGDFIIIGFSDSEDVDITNNKGAYDFWIVRASSEGDLIWQKNFGGSEIDIPYGITKTQDGNYMLAGDTRSADQDVTETIGNADIWTLKFNDVGDILQQKSIGGTQFESARSIVTLQNGNYAITSTTRSNDGDVSSNNGQNDIWTVILDQNLELISEKNIGGSALDFGEDVIQTSDNKIIVVGNTESSDGDITINKGQKDIIISKFN
ncbi:hypothetical protein [Patiriisocius hiemis]|uniref:Bulb-type lectin domain-containing protein n=1 Tax=Patiriisocius hiemis TaxID=3075604 RepID=A0ABU2YC12_9FLAO|nr:hypothetical protein [Constantimarinum sp. W242]MDT0555416.1 hypothetical protein [Constantimarinum sp. W242]